MAISEFGGISGGGIVGYNCIVKTADCDKDKDLCLNRERAGLTVDLLIDT